MAAASVACVFVMKQAASGLETNSRDDLALRTLAEELRQGGERARRVRDFAAEIIGDKIVSGLRFQPRPGQILICRFGAGFEVPENVKTRPVIVLSPHQRRWSGLCVVAPISSKAPDPVSPIHFLMPPGILPGDKYPEAWIKGDMVIAVGRHRLDRFKIGHRQYAAPTAPAYVLHEARRCVLHALGMHSLTIHW